MSGMDCRPAALPSRTFGAHTISLAKGEQITISIMAFADERSCKWHLDADVLVAGEKQTLTLTEAEGTGPLAVSGGVQPTQYQNFYVLSYLLSEATSRIPRGGVFRWSAARVSRTVLVSGRFRRLRGIVPYWQELPGVSTRPAAPTPVEKGPWSGAGVRLSSPLRSASLSICSRKSI
jgi:hypothetical protein